MKSLFVELPAAAAGNSPVRIEYRWIHPELGPESHASPLLVFLHEGLGSAAMWKSWPQDLCNAGGFRGLIYSRPGYGRSTPRPHNERWPLDYLQRQARELLPMLLDHLGVDTTQPLWLIGHSDGASIALLHAAAYPQRVAGAVVMAPHVFVEPIARHGIAATREAYLEGGLRNKLARYHDDVDSAFWGWADTWLDPAFLSWNIEADVAQIRCPLLAIQGKNDEYGTFEQLRRLAHALPAAKLLELAECGHAPYRDLALHVNLAIIDFIASSS